MNMNQDDSYDEDNDDDDNDDDDDDDDDGDEDYGWFIDDEDVCCNFDWQLRSVGHPASCLKHVCQTCIWNEVNWTILEMYSM